VNKKKEQKWWMSRASSTELVPVRVIPVSRRTIKWYDGPTLRVTQVDDGYTSFHQTLKEAIDHKRKRLKRDIVLMKESGDDPWRYEKQLEEMKRYD